MEQDLAFLLPLLLGLLQQGRGGRLEVEPPEPVVAVAVGESRQLTCRRACADGRAAVVQWRGLDTSLGAVQSGAGSSVLSVHNASLSSAGIHTCVGTCGTHTLRHHVRLLVFAFPDQLTVSPEALVAGQAQELACTAHNITPASPDVLSLSLLLGDQELEGVQDLGQEEDEEPQEGEDQLFQVTKRWQLPPLGKPAPLTLHCQATMRLPGMEPRSHRKPISVRPQPPWRPSWSRTPPTAPGVLTSPKAPVTTSLEATLEQASTHSPQSPGPEAGNSSTRPCQPEIHQSPIPGGSPPMSTALWMGSLVLGLLLLAFLTRRLWRCRQPTR
ncbi:unnamed protein product [Pipistrellus nathusii]|uniref:Ig-like domain-containing protein n=1 Tax=Pipistrellus nathusii TaxID=59473 RepID=A0ABP0A5I1_PIPNA